MAEQFELFENSREKARKRIQKWEENDAHIRRIRMFAEEITNPLSYTQNPAVAPIRKALLNIHTKTHSEREGILQQAEKTLTNTVFDEDDKIWVDDALQAFPQLLNTLKEQNLET